MISLIFALKTSLIICAINASTWDGMIFGNIRAFIDYIFNDKLSVELRKPLYDCIICMASIWGGGIYVYHEGLNVGVIPHILLVAGINVILSGIIFLAYERNSNSLPNE